MNITGTITKDAEIRTTQAGKQFVTFNIAVNDSYKTKQGERVSHTAFFNCVFWLSTKIAKHLKKGRVVELIGRLSANAYTDRQGQVKASMNLNTADIKLFGAASRDTRDESIVDKPAETEDLPF